MANAVLEQSVPIHRDSVGRSIRIPDEFVLVGDVATIRQDNAGRLIVEAAQPRKTLTEVLASMRSLPRGESLPEIEDYPAEPVDF